MQSIPTLFEREMTGRKALAVRQVNPECAWVLDGEGRATTKWDGTACAVFDGQLWKRLKMKQGREVKGWMHWSVAPFAPVVLIDGPTPRSGHGWVRVGDGPEDWMHRRVLENRREGLPDNVSCLPEPGTYELVGPGLQKNPHKLHIYELRRHGGEEIPVPDLSFDDLGAYLALHELEGIVWHHEDGRMAKLKRRDFGIPWPSR